MADAPARLGSCRHTAGYGLRNRHFGGPLARAGHRVHACDFAEAMLAILNQRAAQESLPITSHLLAWDDDWQAAGLGENSVDVAFASRSLMAADVQPYIRKLDLAARVKAAVVVPGGSLPSADPQLLAHLGRPAAPPRAVESVKRVLADLGRVPVLWLFIIEGVGVVCGVRRVVAG